jgi:receptor expression-enhancing protein 5/6
MKLFEKSRMKGHIISLDNTSAEDRPEGAKRPPTVPSHNPLFNGAKTALRSGEVVADKLMKEVDDVPMIAMLAAMTKQSKGRIVLGSSILVFALVYSFAGLSGISNGVGFVFPAILMFRAIQQPRRDDDIQWMTYWAVFIGFWFLETFLFLRQILAWKSYDGLKLGMLLYLFLPGHRGAVLLYNKQLHEYLGPFRGKFRAITGITPAANLAEERDKSD